MQWIFISICIINFFGQFFCEETEDKKVEADIYNITEKDLTRDYSNSGGKELTLDGETNEKAIVFPKKSLFGENFEIRECSKSGCKKETLSKEEKRKYDRCNYEGYVVSDPDSKVSFIKCNENGVKDIVIVAEKANLTHDAYRIDPEGKVGVSQLKNFTDEISEDDYTGDDYEEAGTDYADDSSETIDDMYFDKKGNLISIEKLDQYQCNNKKRKKKKCWECCKPLKWKGCTKEEALEKVQKKSSPVLEEEIKGANCTAKVGKKLCKGSFKKAKSKKGIKKEKKGITSCSDLKEHVRRKAKAQSTEIRNILKAGELDKKSKKGEQGKKPKDGKKSKGNKNSKDYEKLKENRKSKESKSPEDADEEEDNSDYDSAYDDTIEYKDKSYSKTKHNRELTKAEMLRLVRKINEVKPQKENPKCKKNLFRSMVFIQSRCGKSCRKKDPIPPKKVYSRRTAEIGVYIDRQLYQEMANNLGTSDSAKIKEKLVEMTHSIFVEVETFLTHKTFTSMRGGFRIAINGIQIYTEKNKETEEWEKASRLSRVLRKFEEFANKVNSACDAEEDSFDVMVLFTGRGDSLRDVGPRHSVGFAYIGAVCKISPVTVLTVRLDGRGSHDMTTSRLLSHELGHLFGSDHDGTVGKNPDGIFYREAVPCPPHVNLMSPSVSPSMTVWSNCTRNMIDAEYERRETEDRGGSKNCFFT